MRYVHNRKKYVKNITNKQKNLSSINVINNGKISLLATKAVLPVLDLLLVLDLGYTSHA